MLRWRRAVVEAWQAKALSNDSCRDLLVLMEYALADGALKKKGDDPKAWWREEQLARFLCITRKTLRARLNRWHEAGWIGARKPANPNLPMERWLCIPVVGSSRTQSLPYERGVTREMQTTLRNGSDRRVGAEVESTLRKSVPQAAAIPQGSLSGRPQGSPEIGRDPTYVEEAVEKTVEAPPDPPRATAWPVDAFRNTQTDDPIVELAKGMHELLRRVLSQNDLIECQLALNQYAYLSAADLLARARDHVDYCRDHELPTPRTVAGFADSWRRENDYRADRGHAKATRDRRTSLTNGLSQLVETLTGRKAST